MAILTIVITVVTVVSAQWDITGVVMAILTIVITAVTVVSVQCTVRHNWCCHGNSHYCHYCCHCCQCTVRHNWCCHGDSHYCCCCCHCCKRVVRRTWCQLWLGLRQEGGGQGGNGVGVGGHGVLQNLHLPWWPCPHSIAEIQPHYHTTPTPTTLSHDTNTDHISQRTPALTALSTHHKNTTTLSHYTNTNHISQRTPAPTALFTPQKHNHTTPTPITLAREHLPWWPCTRTTVSQKPDRLYQQKSETRMTASVLKQDPNTKSMHIFREIPFIKP